MRTSLPVLAALSFLIFSGCVPAPPAMPSAATLSPSPPATLAPLLTPIEAGLEPVAEPDHHSDVDLSRLPLGDQRISGGPQPGYAWTCSAQFDGRGAQGTGAWMNGDGTWDLTKKLTVDGAVSWPHSFTITAAGDRRVFLGNDLPDHPTGVFPIDPADDAYQIDRNPNSIQARTVRIELPLNPALAAGPSCVGGEVGILLSGVLIFNAFDAQGRDAVAHEVQDQCQGHPQADGVYHYHSLSDCIADNAAGHSELVGYAFDGFGIYGYYGVDGSELTNAQLDECHGHTHLVDWDGALVEMYHYHATHEFPYVLGCFQGAVAVRGALGGQPVDQPAAGGQPGIGQPPQAALDACAGLAQDAACTLNTPNGALSGTCRSMPGSTQLACVPAGAGAPPGP